MPLSQKAFKSLVNFLQGKTHHIPADVWEEFVKAVVPTTGKNKWREYWGNVYILFITRIRPAYLHNPQIAATPQSLVRYTRTVVKRSQSPDKGLPSIPAVDRLDDFVVEIVLRNIMKYSYQHDPPLYRHLKVVQDEFRRFLSDPPISYPPSPEFPLAAYLQRVERGDWEPVYTSVRVAIMAHCCRNEENFETHSRRVRRRYYNFIASLSSLSRKIPHEFLASLERTLERVCQGLSPKLSRHLWSIMPLLPPTPYPYLESVRWIFLKYWDDLVIDTVIKTCCGRRNTFDTHNMRIRTFIQKALRGPGHSEENP